MIVDVKEQVNLKSDFVIRLLKVDGNGKRSVVGEVNANLDEDIEKQIAQALYESKADEAVFTERFYLEPEIKPEDLPFA